MEPEAIKLITTNIRLLIDLEYIVNSSFIRPVLPAKRSLLRDDSGRAVSWRMNRPKHKRWKLEAEEKLFQIPILTFLALLPGPILRVSKHVPLLRGPSATGLPVSVPDGVSASRLEIGMGRTTVLRLTAIALNILKRQDSLSLVWTDDRGGGMGRWLGHQDFHFLEFDRIFFPSLRHHL